MIGSDQGKLGLAAGLLLLAGAVFWLTHRQDLGLRDLAGDWVVDVAALDERDPDIELLRRRYAPVRLVITSGTVTLSHGDQPPRELTVARVRQQGDALGVFFTEAGAAEWTFYRHDGGLSVSLGPHIVPLRRP